MVFSALRREGFVAEDFFSDKTGAFAPEKVLPGRTEDPRA